MIIFKHALKRCFSQPLVFFIILLLPLAVVFIPKQGGPYPNGIQLYGMISLFSAFLLCKPIAEDCINNIMLRISSAPINYIVYLSSHLIAYVLILLGQSTIFLLGFYLYWQDTTINYVLIFSLYLVFNIMALTFCLFWNSLFKSYSLAFGLFSGAASLMSLVSGISMPLRLIPEGIRKFALLLPTYWLPYGLDSLLNGNIKYVLISHVILLIFSGIFLLIGGRRRY